MGCLSAWTQERVEGFLCRTWKRKIPCNHGLWSMLGLDEAQIEEILEMGGSGWAEVKEIGVSGMILR